MKKSFIISTIKNGLSQEKKLNDHMVLGRAWSEQHSFSSSLYSMLGKYNYNNIMMHLRSYSNKKHHEIAPQYSGTFNFSRYIEKLLLIDLSNLLQLKFHALSGYSTSGGTESNMYALWCARNWAEQQKQKKKTVWIIPKSSHYSIDKSLNVLAISTSSKHAVSYIHYEKDFSINGQKIIQEIKKTGKKTPIIIVLTAITTELGLLDPIHQVLRHIKNNSYKNIYVHIDACYSGLIIPFTNMHSLFSYPSISSIALDFHKMFGGPIGSGAVLLNNGLEKYAQVDASYIQGGSDFTLLGSRSGIHPIQNWALLQLKGRNGIQNEIQKAHDLTMHLYNNLKKVKTIKILYKPFINYLIFSIDVKNENTHKSFDELCYKYSISNTTIRATSKNKSFYKMIINHYTPKKVLNAFVKEVEIWTKKSTIK